MFLFIPDGVLSFFNYISSRIGMEQAPLQGKGFFLILGAGYMYLVSLLAYMMYRCPENRYFPLLLANGKLASSVLSLYMFLTHKHYLIYAANCIVDGTIGAGVLLMYLKTRKAD